MHKLCDTFGLAKMMPLVHRVTIHVIVNQDAVLLLYGVVGRQVGHGPNHKTGVV